MSVIVRAVESDAVVPPTPVAPTTPVVRNVLDYGADRTGVQDSGLAVRAALAAAPPEPGGLHLHFPPGRYKIVALPRTTDPLGLGVDGNPIVIDRSNVTFSGAGPEATTLFFRGYGDTDPSASYQTVLSAVFRGSGLVIKGGTSSGARISNIAIRDLAFDGGAGTTGNGGHPADVSTGDGWDITHKAVRIMENTYVSNITIDNCYLHSWRGEVVYHAGRNSRNIVGRNLRLGDTNGSIWCVENGRLTDSYLYSTAAHGVENTTQTEPLLLARNRIEDCLLYGMYLRFQSLPTALGVMHVRDNYITRCDTGIRINGNQTPTVLVGNEIEDATTRGIDVQGLTKGVDVLRNRITNRTRTAGMGILVSADAGSGPIRVSGNHVERLPDAITGSFVFTDSYSINFANAAGSTFDRNTAIGTNFHPTTTARATNTLITATTATAVAKLRPVMTRPYLITVNYRVVNATTTVKVYIEWYDAAGTVRSTTPVNNVATAVGFYQLAPIVIENIAGTESQQILVEATCGTANNVFVTATIAEL